MASTALPRPLLSLLQAGVLLALATIAAAQTEFPHAAGTDSTGRAQAVSDAAGRVMIESPEFPRGLWVDVVDWGKEAAAGIQVEYGGRPDSLVVLRCVDPSHPRYETWLWTRPSGRPLRLRLGQLTWRPLVEGRVRISWRIDRSVATLLESEQGHLLSSWEAAAAFLLGSYGSYRSYVDLEVDSSVAPAFDPDHLRGLSADGGHIVDVSPLATLSNLEWLELRGNQIVDVSPLASLTRLEWLGGATPVRWTVRCFRLVWASVAVVEWKHAGPGARVEYGAPV